MVDFIELIDLFESEYKQTDPRTIVVTSPQQKICYAYARKNKIITAEFILNLYTGEKTAMGQLKWFIFMGFVKETKEENIYEYIEYKEESKGIKND